MTNPCARALRRISLLRRALAALSLSLMTIALVSASPLDAAMNESVVRIPVQDAPDLRLETTIFKPDGPGPFPLVVFNHGRDAGDPRMQPRSRPLAFAREFVRRGYVVAVPNRRGFAGSDGTYPDTGCDLEADGVAQARDIAATVDALARTGYVDASRVLVAGVSHGGFASLAYGASDFASTASSTGTAAPLRVRGILNFSGGLRKDACARWRDTLTRAFADFGARTRVPTLWFYGDNDRVFDAPLVASLDRAYVSAGGIATRIDYGRYKDDAHGLVGDRDGVRIWWPATQRFLQAVGMPTAIAYRIDDPRDARPRPHASGYAALDAVDAVPYLDDTGRIAYLRFLAQPNPRVFAISQSGRWSWAAGGDDPFAEAIDTCSQRARTPCKAYAIDDIVVWQGR
ncbi:dienelactone hydrolase family protein [Pararobbsia silviterrae]|uniref:Xaa-Pro dipeptidyl-peptidase-like domain-containing protein n=1 Tax=Pararobbsia silviterrae TaxID=1792498 RepID=A0A494YEF8_9BURK|nr:CocE/NonD family hydrolase [Pararobbsia silviterrae]RKP58743.1 hypothetical protein D7S86_02075 [Pararobbsia silviterrae]